MRNGRRVFGLNDAYITIYREVVDSYGNTTYTLLWSYLFVQDLDVVKTHDVVEESVYNTVNPNVEVNSESKVLNIRTFYYNKARSFLNASDPSELYRFTILFQTIEDPNQWDQYNCYSCRNNRWSLTGRDNDIVNEGVSFVPSSII